MDRPERRRLQKLKNKMANGGWYSHSQRVTDRVWYKPWTWFKWHLGIGLQRRERMSDGCILFDLWMEGYIVQGNKAGAKKIASSIKADSFRDAVIAFSETKAAKGYGDFDKDSLSFWDCRCFQSEQEARKGFG